MFGAGVLVFVGAFGANRLLRPSDPAEPPGKRIAYESGIDPVGGDWAQAQIRYYVYAYLYVLFAVEAVFLFPWAVVFDRAGFGATSVTEMGVFVGGARAGHPLRLAQEDPDLDLSCRRRVTEPVGVAGSPRASARANIVRMGQLLLFIVVAVVVAAIVFGVTVMLSGGDSGLTPVEADGRAVPLPSDRPLGEDDIGADQVRHRLARVPDGPGRPGAAAGRLRHRLQG